VPGQVYYAASRRLVLQGVDGVVFVADSQPGRMSENQESWYMLEQHLVELGNDVTTFPIIIQVNKRDLPHSLPADHIRTALGVNGRPCFEASAIKGAGVVNTLKAIMRSVIVQVGRNGMR
jgi:signal recognition particle receptor subunit beta